MGYTQEQDGRYHVPDADETDAPTNEELNQRIDDLEGRLGKLLPDADEIDATVQVYKRLGLKTEKLVDDVQSIIDKIKFLLPFAKEV